MATKKTTTKTSSSKKKTSTKTATVGVNKSKKSAKGVKSSSKKTNGPSQKAVIEAMKAAALMAEIRAKELEAIRKAELKAARKVGNWGTTIWFEVSSSKQLTFRNFNKTHSARWTEHEVIGKKPLSEFSGPDLVTVTMSCVFSVTMNINPRKTMTALEKALEKGTVDYLYIKERKVGSYKMKLTNMSEAYDVVLINGAIAKATVDLTFSEYVTKSYKHGKKVAGTKVPWEFIVGEKPTFTGGKVYKTNSSKKGKKKAAAKVIVTKYQKGKTHPYYVKTVAAKGWKGWVDDGTLKA